MDGTTDSLRALATNWSLAGDEKLLNLLKSTHQKIISKCRDVNTQLDVMVSSLDSASVNLQNVNNRFMALSNSQFIESRVYDDDADVDIETKPVEAQPTQPEVADELALLKQSLQVVDSAHETTEILDESDSDDSDVQISVVLKPKDEYAHRPLPHIIGSQSWKNKWHAGLVIEDSDTESTTSRQDDNIDQYSDSDDDLPTDTRVPNTTRSNISGSSSSLHSSKELRNEKTPAAVAAQLQAWLGSAPLPVPTREPDDIPTPASKTVYRPQKPVSSTIFSDEPPPLDEYTEPDPDPESQDDDIFAEINKQHPYDDSRTSRNVDDLFGTVTGQCSDFRSKVETGSAKQKPTLFDDESEPELLADKPPKIIPKENRIVDYESHTKKPIGGISLFGSNKGTESIGAAILNRNRRKSSSSSDDGKNSFKNDSYADKSYNSDEDNDANAIFDNLFAKAKQAEQKLANPGQFNKEKPEPVKEKAIPAKKPTKIVIEPPKPAKDLFSDNIFDDIDDIFTDIKIPSKEASKNAKSIFDDDDDDLFADIAKKDTTVIKDTNVVSAASSGLNKSIFDSDDDLFGDVKMKSESSKKETESRNNNITKENSNNTKAVKPQIKKTILNTPEVKDQIPKVISKSIFDSDSDDDLFFDVKIKTPEPKTQETNKISIVSKTVTDIINENKDTKHTSQLKTNEKPVFQSPSLFEEDEIDDLFINANKAKNSAPDISDIKQIVPDHKPNPTQEMNNQNKDFDFIDKNIEKNSEITRDNVNNTNPITIVEDELSKLNNIETKPDLFGDNLEDDLSPKQENIDSKKVNDDMFSKDDVIESSQKGEVQRKNSLNDLSVKPKSDGHNSKDFTENRAFKIETHYEEDTIHEQQTTVNNPSKENQTVLPETIFSPAFDDILSEPPAFEKTKESKKSNNVNALFEDDSDDEALFFKKNDNISDEKPDIFSPSADFGIYADEPPALDIYFIQKSKDDDNSDLFRSVPKSSKNEPPKIGEWDDEQKGIKTIPIATVGHKTVPENMDTDLFGISHEPEGVRSHEIPYLSTNYKPRYSQETHKNILNEKSKNDKTATAITSNSVKNNETIATDDELFSDIPKVSECNRKKTIDITKGIDQVDENTKGKQNVIETKVIGKIDTKSLNINVQALVPGASPKKIVKDRSNDDIKNYSKTDELKTTNVKETTEVDHADAKLTKSISFESEADSGVLDNKLSKLRAKIQVKRRPSTRRARHEAVRKSVINIDDDTDNSSSLDEPKAKTKNKTIETVKHEQTKELNEPRKTEVIKHEYIDSTDKTKEEKSIEPEIIDIAKNSTQNIKDKLDDINKLPSNQSKSNNENARHLENTKEIDVVDSKSEMEKKIDDSRQKVAGELSPQSTTKVVYILNDEDIFETRDKNNIEIDNEDLFKTGIKAIKESNDSTNKRTTDAKSISQDMNSEKTKNNSEASAVKSNAKSVFNISDDEDELFGKPTKKVEVKSKLFDSDSEDDLFSGNKNKRGNTKANAKVTGSLFGDDDDNLFAVKTKTVSDVKKTTNTPTKPTTSKNAAKSSEIAFADPLSMLDED